MVYVVFVCGVMAGMCVAALVWAGMSSALVVAGFGVLLLLSAFLSSAVAAVIAGSGDPAGHPLKKAQTRES